MIELPTQTPTEWGTDVLSRFEDDAHFNAVATFSNLRTQYDTMLGIDNIYRQMIECLNQSPEIIPGMLLFRSHSAFRAAARLGLSGQVAEAYMCMRGALESALYGLYMSSDTARQEIWLRRHDDNERRKQVRKEFSHKKVLGHLELKNPDLHAVADSLYERTIDFGGHPNERAVNGQFVIESSEERELFTADYFNCGDLSHKACLRSTAQVGICCLKVFGMVFTQRFRILALDQRLIEVSNGF